MNSEGKQISMAASAIALRGVRIFLTAGRHGAERPQTQGTASAPRPKPKGKKPVVGSKPPQKVFEMLIKTTKFNKKYQRIGEHKAPPITLMIN